MISSFASLADAFLKETYDDSPVLASSLGLTEYDDRLDDLSAARFDRRRETDHEWLRRFRAVRDEDLDAQERIDRDFVTALLRGREILHPHEMWKRQPATYLGPGLQGVFALFLHRLRPERDLVDASRARLEKVEDNLRDGMANLDFAKVPAIYVERALGQARAAIRYARELVPAGVSDAALRQRLAASGERAATAYERFTSFLETNASRASGAYAIGEETYSALLRERELLPYDARELRERGRAEYARIASEMRLIATELEGTEDFFAVVARLMKAHAPTPDAMRAEYEEWTERARSFLRDTGLVTLPADERCLVEPSPPFQRPVLAVASYQGPPAFSSSLVGHFFVPYPPDGTQPDEVQRRLEDDCSAGIPTTAVHEAYPGHHWHGVMRRRGASRLRNTFGTSYFGEGWALYAERVMRERGFFTDPRQELFQHNETLFRAARVVVDTSLHLGEMSFDDAVAFMTRDANRTEPNARAEVGRYCSWPTQAASYLTGMLEILAIRERWLRRRGGALREFHDAMASSGSLPPALTERAILGERVAA